MKKKILKVLAFGLVLTMCFAGLTGCKSEEEKQKEAAEELYNDMVDEAKDYVEDFNERQEDSAKKVEAQDAFFDGTFKEISSVFDEFQEGDDASNTEELANNYNKLVKEAISEYTNEYYTEEDLIADLELNHLFSEMPEYLINARNVFLNNYEDNSYGIYIDAPDKENSDFGYYFIFDDGQIITRIKGVFGDGTVKDLDLTSANNQNNITYSQLNAIQDGHVYLYCNIGDDSPCFDIDFTKSTPEIGSISKDNIPGEYEYEETERGLYITDLVNFDN